MATPNVPGAVIAFYDEVFNNPGQADSRLIRSILDKNYNSRPNPLNPMEGNGPFPEGVENLVNYFDSIFPTFNIERKQSVMCQSPEPVTGQFAAVMSSIEAVVADNVPQGGLPMFPGIDVARLRGKYFKTLAIDVHLVRDEKISRTWHAEDWASALTQMLKGNEEPLLDNPKIRPGQLLTKFPRALRNFYDRVLSDVGMKCFTA